MFDRKEGRVYAADELADAAAALLAARHAEMRDAGKAIGKLLSASNRVVKVGAELDIYTPSSLPANLTALYHLPSTE
jgi:hypothetical protein